MSRVHYRGPAPGNRNDFKTIRSLLPFVWEFKYRVLIAMAFLVAAKVASVITPLYLKDVVDALSLPQNLIVLPVAALLG